jgi:hypothetical protein
MAINKCGQCLALGERVPRGPLLERPARLDLSQRGRWFSLSPRERAGVRGMEPPKLERGLGGSLPQTAGGASGLFTPWPNTANLTSYWNERKAPETGVVPISSGYTLEFWRGREERCQTQFL